MKEYEYTVYMNGFPSRSFANRINAQEFAAELKMINNMGIVKHDCIVTIKKEKVD